MATSALPPGGLVLHGLAEDAESKQKSARSAILCKLDSSVVQDARKAANNLYFLSGSTPVGHPPRTPQPGNWALGR